MENPESKAISVSLCDCDICSDTACEGFLASHTRPPFRLTMCFITKMWMRKWGENSWCSYYLLSIFSMSCSFTDGTPWGTVSTSVLKQSANYFAKPQHIPSPWIMCPLSFLKFWGNLREIVWIKCRHIIWNDSNQLMYGDFGKELNICWYLWLQ